MLTTSPRIELLLVANEPTSMQQTLESQGLRVLAETDCAAALQVVRGHHFDVVLVANRCQHQAEFLNKLSATDDALQILVLVDFAQGAKVGELIGLSDRVQVEPISQSTPVTELRWSLRRAGEMTHLRRENSALRRRLRRAEVGNAAERGDDDSETPIAVVATAAVQVGGDIDLATLNRAHVLSVLNQHAGNKARAARALGINRRSLYRLLEKYVSTVGGPRYESVASETADLN